jgi:hypothetical protein
MTSTRLVYTTPANRHGQTFEVAIGDLVKTDGSAGSPLAFVVEKADHTAGRLMFRGKVRGRPVWCFAEEVGGVENRT